METDASHGAPDAGLDARLVTAAFTLAAEDGWKRVRVARAARLAGVPLDQARARFPGSGAILMKFGRLADQAALAAAGTDGGARDRLFDLLMQRLEFLQAHRDGVLAVLRELPRDPGLALLLAAASRRSMGWMLEAAGVDTTGLDGALRVSGALAVWLWVVRAWERDTSPDLSTTMTALDRALSRAEQAAGWLSRGGRGVSSEPAFAAAETSEPDAPQSPEPDLPVVLPEAPPD